MSKPDKPIFNQQGGRGKLYGPTHGATYMGTYQMPDGKIDRRMFNCATNKDAIRAYTDWCADMDARILEAMKEKVRPKAKAQQPKEKPAYTEPFKKDPGSYDGYAVYDNEEGEIMFPDRFSGTRDLLLPLPSRPMYLECEGLIRIELQNINVFIHDGDWWAAVKNE